MSVLLQDIEMSKNASLYKFPAFSASSFSHLLPYQFQWHWQVHLICPLKILSVFVLPPDHLLWFIIQSYSEVAPRTDGVLFWFGTVFHICISKSHADRSRQLFHFLNENGKLWEAIMNFQNP